MNTLDFVDQASLREDIPAFGAGDTVNVHVKVIEGTKERIQVFKGVVPRAFSERRPHRGSDPWRYAQGQAVLPARTAW